MRLRPKVAQKPGSPDRSTHVLRVMVEGLDTEVVQGAVRTGRVHKTLVTELRVPEIDVVRKCKPLHVALEYAGITTSAMVDTGSEITVIRESLIHPESMQPSGTLRLVPAFGGALDAIVVSLTVSLRQLASVVGSPKVQLFCAVTDSLAEGLDCLL